MRCCACHACLESIRKIQRVFAWSATQAHMRIKQAQRHAEIAGVTPIRRRTRVRVYRAHSVRPQSKGATMLQTVSVMLAIQGMMDRRVLLVKGASTRALMDPICVRLAQHNQRHRQEVKTSQTASATQDIRAKAAAHAMHVKWASTKR